MNHVSALNRLWTAGVLSIGLLFTLMPAAAAEELARFDCEDLTGLQPPSGVELSLVDGQEGKAVAITYAGQGPVSVPLYTVPVTGTGKGQLRYSARVRGENVQGQAYLELLCFLGNEGPFFSRALNEPLKGTTSWMSSAVPFFIAADQTPSHATLGIRFEGPGTVMVDNLALSRYSWLNPAAVLGMLFGLMGGVYGICSGILIPRGKGQRFLMGLTYVFLAISLGTLALGAGKYLSSTPDSEAYPFVLVGVIGTVLWGFFLFQTPRLYRLVERERMQAIEASETVE